MEGGELKAVDDVNFEIKEGEVFGLVRGVRLRQNDDRTLHYQAV